MSNLFRNESEMTIYEKVREWHQSKGLIFEENLITQSMKLIEELSEFHSIDREDVSEEAQSKRIDAIGDSLVCISSCCDILKLILKIDDLCLEKILFGGKSELPDVFDLLRDLSSSVLKNKPQKVLDTLISTIKHIYFLTWSFNLPKPSECLEFAYNEIKDRTGKVVDGNFIKEADL